MNIDFAICNDFIDKLNELSGSTWLYKPIIPGAILYEGTDSGFVEIKYFADMEELMEFLADLYVDYKSLTPKQFSKNTNIEDSFHEMAEASISDACYSPIKFSYIGKDDDRRQLKARNP